MPGTQVKDWDLYHSLRRKGYSKEAAARIANSIAGKKVKKHGEGSHPDKTHGNWARLRAPVGSTSHLGSSRIGTKGEKVYHASRRSNRESILAEGLRLSDVDRQHLWVVTDSKVVSNFGFPYKTDVWEIDAEGLHLYGEFHPGFSSDAERKATWVLHEVVPPSRLKLLRGLKKHYGPGPHSGTDTEQDIHGQAEGELDTRTAQIDRKELELDADPSLAPKTKIWAKQRIDHARMVLQGLDDPDIELPHKENYKRRLGGFIQRLNHLYYDCVNREAIGKHYGPADHPSGTPQSDHGRKGTGPQSEADVPSKAKSIPGSDNKPHSYEPGTIPIPPDYVRLYHYTQDEGIVDKIAAEGFRLTAARGSTYGEPDGIWFSTRIPSEGIKEFVEIAVPKEFIKTAVVGGWADSDWDYTARQYPDKDPIESFQAGVHDMVFAQDISPSVVVAVHKPWYSAYRYLQEYRTEVEAGEYDWVYGDQWVGSNERLAVEAIKGEVTKHYGPRDHPSGTPQSVHAPNGSHTSQNKPVQSYGTTPHTGTINDTLDWFEASTPLESASAVFNAELTLPDGSTYTSEVIDAQTNSADPLSNDIYLDGVIKDKDGIRIGSFSRVLDVSDQKVYNASFSISPEHQGKGIGTMFLSHWEDEFVTVGVKRMEVSAVSVGRYAWAVAGYDWYRPYAERAKNTLQALFDDPSSKDFDPELRSQIETLVNRSKLPTATEVAYLGRGLSSTPEHAWLARTYPYRGERPDRLKPLSGHFGKLFLLGDTFSTWTGEKPLGISKSLNSYRSLWKLWATARPDLIESDSPEWLDAVVQALTEPETPTPESVSKFLKARTLLTNLWNSRPATVVESIMKHPYNGSDIHSTGTGQDSHGGDDVSGDDAYRATPVEISTLPNLPSRHYWIRHSAIADFTKEVDRLGRRSAKMGFEPLALRVVPNSTHTLTREDKSVVAWDEVEITGDPPVLPGYEFLAKIEHLQLEGGDYANILKPAPGRDIADDLLKPYRNAGPNCDMCHRKIYRRETFIVRNTETGKLVQLGRDDLKAYTGIDDIESQADYLSIWAKLEVEANEFGGEGEGERGLEIQRFMEHASAEMRDNGFRKTSDFSGSTRDAIYGRMDYLRRKGRLPEGASMITEADTARAEKVIEWARDLDDPASDYLWNVHVALSSPYGVTSKTSGIAASAIRAYERQMEIDIKRTAERTAGAASEWVGTVKERRDFNLTITRANTFEGNYGTTFVYNFKDDDGNALVWFASNPIEAGDLLASTGDRIRVKATVKAHDTDTFRGANTKQTVITRGSVLEVLPAKVEAASI